MVDMWLVRAGENAFLIDDFKDLNVVAMGWEVEDLSGKTPNRIKEIIKKKYPKTNHTIFGYINQASKFVHDFRIGDFVLSIDSKNEKYLVGKIMSDYYYSDIISKKYDIYSYKHLRNVEWIGETNFNDLKDIDLDTLNSEIDIKINNSAKNKLLEKMDYDKIEWTDFYMEFADKLLKYKNNRRELIDKIKNLFDELDMKLPTLDQDSNNNVVEPQDIDPFTVFALFNKQISSENRINLVNQIKKEFSLSSSTPYTFHGIAVVNNLKATFYRFNGSRGENDIDNLWELFELALNFKKDNCEEFMNCYNEVYNQEGIRWNITMGLNWIKPYIFINLDANNRDILASDEIFTVDFKNEIKSLKTPPKADQYIKICNDALNQIKHSDKYSSFPDLSHGAYMNKGHIDDPGEGIGDNDIETVRYWLISAGKKAEWWDEFYRDGLVGIGMDGAGDLSKYANEEEIKNKFQEIFNDDETHMNDVRGCWQFVHDMKIDDVIFVKRGINEIIGAGIIESNYEYDASKTFSNIRKVNWARNGLWYYNNSNFPVKTLTDITDKIEMVDEFKRLLNWSNESPVYPMYDMENFLGEAYLSEIDYNTLINLIKAKKNIIVEGPPGVGKTFIAKRLAYSMMGVKDVERVMMVQFHQSYSYEDFVMGYRPFERGFRLEEGAFYKFCKKAEDDPENDYFFIIDEINRGNISKIFGELFMLIESDKRGEKNKIQLLYSDELFFIPKNLYIIGLMNTADRSLAMIDYALRRRFSFFDLKPAFKSKGFENYQTELNNKHFNDLIEIILKLNSAIMNDDSLGEGFVIGHSFLCNIKPEEIDEKLKYIVCYELIPLLNEYWFDDAKKVKDWARELRSVLNENSKNNYY